MPNLHKFVYSKIDLLKIPTFPRIFKLQIPIITNSNNQCLAGIGQKALFAETTVHFTKQAMQDVSFIYYYLRFLCILTWSILVSDMSKKILNHVRAYFKTFKNSSFKCFNSGYLCIIKKKNTFGSSSNFCLKVYQREN